MFAIHFASGQTAINNSRTERHKQIAGTNFFLVPPVGFTAATNFQGFQQVSSGSSILVVEIPGPFAETTRGFTEQGLKAQGVTLRKKEDVTVNGQQGLFITTEQFAYNRNFSKYILVFGDGQITHMINGTFPKGELALDKDIRESLLSVFYDADLTVDPLSTAPFTLLTEGTKLKFAKSMAGALLFTTDGKVPTESTDKTSFMAALSISNVQTADKRLTAMMRMRKLPYTSLKFDQDKINEIEIDGISGYEIAGEGLNNNGIKELIYQVMLFTDNGYYILVGTAQNDFEQNLELFKKVAKTLKRK
jgi:hypothetical protein